MCEIGRSSRGANSALISLAAVAAEAQKPLNVFLAYLLSCSLKKKFHAALIFEFASSEVHVQIFIYKANKKQLLRLPSYAEEADRLDKS